MSDYSDYHDFHFHNTCDSYVDVISASEPDEAVSIAGSRFTLRELMAKTINGNPGFPILVAQAHFDTGHSESRLLSAAIRGLIKSACIDMIANAVSREILDDWDSMSEEEQMKEARNIREAARMLRNMTGSNT